MMRYVNIAFDTHLLSVEVECWEYMHVESMKGKGSDRIMYTQVNSSYQLFLLGRILFLSIFLI